MRKDLKNVKKKNIFKHFTALLTTLVVAFSTFSSTIASAASIKTPEIHLSGWGYDFRNSKVTSNAYDPITKAYTNKNFRSVNGHYCKNYFPYWKDSSGKYSYCVQHGTKHYDAIESELENLINSTRYPDAMRKRLAYATIYSYKGKTKYGYTWDVELVASQLIVWNISARYFDDSTTDLGANEKILLNCITFCIEI